jgi:hypothetical protein
MEERKLKRQELERKYEDKRAAEIEAKRNQDEVLLIEQAN